MQSLVHFVDFILDMSKKKKKIASDDNIIILTFKCSTMYHIDILMNCCYIFRLYGAWANLW